MDHPFDPIPVETLPRGLPSGACPRDPTEKVIDVCSRCGDFLCLRCGSYVGGEVYCRHCKPPELVPADPGQRLRGQLCDGLMYLAAMVVLVLPGLLLKNNELTLVFLPLGLIACFVINAYLLKTSGQSVGKRMVGTRIVTTMGGPAPFGRTLMLRSVMPTLIGYVPGLGSLFGLLDALFVFGKTRQCLHDHMAGTIVVSAAASERVYTRR